MSKSKADMLRLKIDVLRRRRDEIAKSQPVTGFMNGGSTGNQRDWRAAVSRNANTESWQARMDKATADLEAVEAEAIK